MVEPISLFGVSLYRVQVSGSDKDELPHNVTGWLEKQQISFLPMQETWVRKIPGEANGNPLQYSCLGNSTDREAWRATVHGVAKSRT